jgi:O-antigen ligase
VESSRPQALEAGLFLIVVALPLAFFPLSEAAFIDVKLLVLALGTLLVWVSGVPVDRHLAAPALALGVAIALATVFGIDPAESLVGTIRPTGVVTLACTLVLVVVAPSIPGPLLARARVWMVRAAQVLAAIALTEHLAPELLDAVARRESFLGATFGNPVLLAGFLAASIPAAFADEGGSRWRTIAVFAVLGSGFAVIGERSAYLLPLVAFVATWWFLRLPARRIAIAGAVLVTAIAVWTLVPTSGSENADPSRVAGQFGTLGAERQRVAVWGAQIRAIADRPVLGWGPSNGWSAFVSSGTPDQLRTAGRFWGDAHNLLIEVGVISGLLGIAAFLWLLFRLVPRVARAPRSRGWAAASAVTLAVYFLYEPLDVTLIPMLFLLAGAAAGGRVVAPAPAAAWRRPARLATTLILIAATGVAALTFTSASLEQWGRTHAGSSWAFERAWAIAPWRISPAEALAIELAIDARAGDPAAAAEAREVVDRLVDAHPLNPGLRLLAADVELLLRNFPGTQEWIRQHLEIFPSDVVRVPEEEPGITLPG